jgi:hypothetical protein
MGAKDMGVKGGNMGMRGMGMRKIIYTVETTEGEGEGGIEAGVEMGGKGA